MRPAITHAAAPPDHALFDATAFRPPYGAWPAPPHDPRERVSLTHLGVWDLRAFAVGGRFHNFFHRHGLLHVQLWHPFKGVSVLTPSPITRGAYGVYPAPEDRRRCSDYHDAQHVVQVLFEVALPTLDDVEAAVSALHELAPRPRALPSP